jgi:mRNA deadenylase 3'-5' endonuclease subunit Ccr4
MRYPERSFDWLLFAAFWEKPNIKLKRKVYRALDQFHRRTIMLRGSLKTLDKEFARTIATFIINDFRNWEKKFQGESDYVTYIVHSITSTKHRETLDVIKRHYKS